MGRYLGWLANTILFVLCCFLVADTANAILAALLTPVGEAPVESAAPATVASNDWSERRVILERNLFNSSLLAPSLPVDEPEDLEASKLPLDLLGTIASDDPTLASASIHDRDSNRTLVVRVNDEVRSQATVMRIERRRVVLSENGAARELALAEAETSAAPAAPARKRNRAARRPRARRGRAAANAAVTAPEVEQPRAGRTPVNLFSQARVQPHYDGEQMLGIQVSKIKSQSLFENAGLVDNDVIQELNGIPINSPEQTRNVLDVFSSAKELELVVMRGGDSITLTYTMPDEE